MRRSHRSGSVRRAWWLGGTLLASATLAACGSGSNYAGGTTTTTSGSFSTASASFKTTSVAGLGTVVVDGRGYTVYTLSLPRRMNRPCTVASGCTAVWPPLTLAAGAAAPTASGGLEAAALSTTTIRGTRYVTYHHWLLYEFTGDSGPGQSNGQGISSFGGTWRALHPDGTAASTTAATTTTTTYGGY